MTYRTGPSGQSGLLGKFADTWDRLPMKGPMLALAFVGGSVAALLNGGPSQGSCAKTPLRHVYSPSRFTVIATCAHVTGTVIAYRHEHDGDYHISMTIDQKNWTDAANVRGQHGYTVVEFTPLDPKPEGGFVAGQHLKLTVTKVYDEQHKRVSEAHGWVEGHPVFAVKDITPPDVTALPNRPELAPPTEK